MSFLLVRRLAATSAALLIALGGAGTALSAQGTDASIRGVVADSAGAAVAAVRRTSIPERPFAA